MIDFVEQIALRVVESSLQQLKTGNIPVISRYSVSSDGEDIRFTVEMFGKSRVYTIPIIQIVDPVLIEKKVDELCSIFQVNIDSIIFNIRNKELMGK